MFIELYPFISIPDPTDINIFRRVARIDNWGLKNREDTEERLTTYKLSIIQYQKQPNHKPLRLMCITNLQSAHDYFDPPCYGLSNFRYHDLNLSNGRLNLVYHPAPFK